MSDKASDRIPWWIFYPLKGFDISDEEHDLSNPMFSDTTIVSKRHMPQIIKLLKLNEQGDTSYDHEARAISLIENSTLGERFHSFIAVKRLGLVLSSIEPELHCDLIPEIGDNAKKRASQLASLLELSVLAENENWQTCALLDQVQRRTNSLAKIALDDGQFTLEEGGGTSRTIMSELHMERLTRTELNRRLQTYPLAPLSTILIPQSSPVGESLFQSISAASVRLSDAIHCSKEADQILGAVTAIEILITNQGDSYDTLKKRIAALVGQDAFDFFEAENVLYERNRYVHQGIEPAHGALPIKATALALSCILRYAEMAPKFNSKPSIVTCLDFLHLGSKMAISWTQEEKSAFEKFANHIPRRLNFKFFVNHARQKMN